MVDHMEPPAPAGQGGGVMERATFEAQAFFGDVILRVTENEHEPPLHFCLPYAQAKALVKSLTKAARALEKPKA